jgi:hypothetical protein
MLFVEEHFLVVCQKSLVGVLLKKTASSSNFPVFVRLVPSLSQRPNYNSKIGLNTHRPQKLCNQFQGTQEVRPQYVNLVQG